MAVVLEGVVSVTFVEVTVVLGLEAEVVDVDVSFDWRGMIGMAWTRNKYGIKRSIRIGFMLNVIVIEKDQSLGHLEMNAVKKTKACLLCERGRKWSYRGKERE